MTIHRRSDRLLLTGENHNVVKQFPMFGKGAPIYWWAERGLVHWEDAREPGTRRAGMYDSMSWQEAAQRVLSLSQMALNSSEQGYYADERRALQQFVCDMEGVIRQAKEQGGPWDKGAAAEHLRRRSKRVIMPSGRKPDRVIAGKGDLDHYTQGQTALRRIDDPLDL